MGFLLRRVWVVLGLGAKEPRLRPHSGVVAVLQRRIPAYGSRSLSVARGTILMTCILALSAGSCQAPGPDANAEWIDLSPHLMPEAWQATSFGGEGEIEFLADAVELGFGSPLTGLHWAGDLPLGPAYQLEVEASRIDGTDFFCGLNFPIGESAATVVLGGWGGALCGLSCIDGLDASMNATRSFQSFEPGESVRLRVEVSARQVRAWLDEEPLFVIERGGAQFELRTEVTPGGRLGISSFQTRARIHAVRWRALKE